MSTPSGQISSGQNVKLLDSVTVTTPDLSSGTVSSPVTVMVSNQAGATYGTLSLSGTLQPQEGGDYIYAKAYSIPHGGPSVTPPADPPPTAFETTSNDDGSWSLDNLGPISSTSTGTFPETQIVIWAYTSDQDNAVIQIYFMAGQSSN